MIGGPDSFLQDTKNTKAEVLKHEVGKGKYRPPKWDPYKHGDQSRVQVVVVKMTKSDGTSGDSVDDLSNKKGDSSEGRQI